MSASRYSADHDPRKNTSQIVGWWRLGISLAVAIMLCATAALVISNLRLEQNLKRADQRVVDLSNALDQAESTADEQLQALKDELAEARTESLKDDDLDKLKSQLDRDFGRAAARISRLELRPKNLQTLVREATPSVIFLQGTYRLLDPETDKPLRHVMSDGEPRMIGPNIPLLATTGDGPEFEPGFTGTGFMISDDGLLLTNRHVAMPWEPNRFTALLVEENGFKPEVVRLKGFMPGQSEPFDLTMVGASDQADLALLKRPGASEGDAVLNISEKPVQPGMEVVVMGYPTGIRAVLARAGELYVDEAREQGISDYWQLARKLAEDGLIQPLTSRGIVGQVSTAHVVYDAETTSGGSGGPVMTRDGKVVAVNTAVLTDYDGSNLGVPANLIVEFIQSIRDR